LPPPSRQFSDKILDSPPLAGGIYHDATNGLLAPWAVLSGFGPVAIFNVLVQVREHPEKTGKHVIRSLGSFDVLVGLPIG